MRDERFLCLAWFLLAWHRKLLFNEIVYSILEYKAFCTKAAFCSAKVSMVEQLKDILPDYIR